MNLMLQCFILGVLTWLSQAKSYSLPYISNGECRDYYNEYEVDDRCCSKCSPGTRLASECTSEKDTVCELCPAAMFSENMNYYPNCFSCKKCQEEKGLEYAKRCSKDGDAVCVCKPGMFCSLHEEGSCSICQKYRTCGPGKGALEPGTPTENIKCVKCAPGTFSNETSSQQCRPHTRCELQGRIVLFLGNSTTDTVCSPSVATTTSHVTTRSVTVKARLLPKEPVSIPPFLVPHRTAQAVSNANSTRPPDVIDSFWMKVGLPLAVLLVVLLILMITGFCIYHRKGLVKPPVHDAVNAGQTSNSVVLFSPSEHQVLLADSSSSSDPSTSSSSDSHSQGTGVSQDCLHVESPTVSSPVLNVSITATFNCQVNPTTGSCAIPVSHCVPLPEPEFPLSKEEELCMSCEQEDSKDAIQSVQESGMTKY